MQKDAGSMACVLNFFREAGAYTNSTAGLWGIMPALISHVQKLHYRAFPVFTVIQRPIIYIHADKAVCHLRIQIARKLHGISQRGLAMIKRILNTVAQCFGHLRNQLRPQFATNRIPAQRQRQSQFAHATIFPDPECVSALSAHT